MTKTSFTPQRSFLRSSLSLVVLLLLSLSQLNCKGEGSDDNLKQSVLPSLQVKLPPSPSFKKDHPPLLYPDQTLSVYGIKKQASTYRNKVARVKGYIFDVYQCPSCPKGAKCKPCNAPHFFLTDRKLGPKDQGIIVTDYPKRDPKTRRRIRLKVGARHIITGLFTKRSGTGFSSSDGLLVFRGYSPAESE